MNHDVSQLLETIDKLTLAKAQCEAECDANRLLIEKQRAALQAVYDELGKHSRWNVSDLRLKVIKPLL